MRKRSVEQQFSALRPTIKFAAHMHYWLLAGAVLGVILALVFWHPVPLMIAAFLGIVGFAEQRAGPNIVAAIAAYDSDAPTPGHVDVTITSGDTTDHYRATLQEAGHPDWAYQFVPQGWGPTASRYTARIWREAEGTPLLAVVEDGILIPRYAPTRVNPEGRAGES